MSYDVDFIIDTGAGEFVEVSRGLNHTYNCADMFKLALSGKGLLDLNWKLCRDVEDQVTKAFRHMDSPDNKWIYELLEPKNGWGDHGSATTFMLDILHNIVKHPNATIRIT